MTTFLIVLFGISSLYVVVAWGLIELVSLRSVGFAVAIGVCAAVYAAYFAAATYWNCIAFDRIGAADITKHPSPLAGPKGCSYKFGFIDRWIGQVFAPLAALSVSVITFRRWAISRRSRTSDA